MLEVRSADGDQRRKGNRVKPRGKRQARNDGQDCCSGTGPNMYYIAYSADGANQA